MATQTGSIDLRGANSAKLYVDDEAGEIRTEVSETYATKTEVQRTDAGSGTVISSDDAANLPPLSLTIHGKSVQDGTPSPSSPVPIQSVEGRNLLDVSGITGSTTVNGITWTANGDGTFHAVGTSTAASTLGLGNFMLESGKRYIVSGSPTGGSSSNWEIMVQSGTATTSGGWQHDYGSGAAFNGIGAERRLQLVVRSGRTVDFTFKPQIEYAETSTAYRPYPFQPYQHITDVITGRNMLPKGNTTTMAGVSYVVRDDGSVRASGTATATSFWASAVYLPAGTYAFSGCPAGGSDTTYRIDMRDALGGSGLSGVGSDSGNGNKFTLTAPKMVYLNIRINNGYTANNLVFYPQIEYGTEKTEYTPYTDASAFIPLQDHALRSLPDGTEDVLEVDGEGNVTLTKNTTTKVFDGSETWTQNSVTANNLRMVTTVADLVSVTNTDTVKRAISSMLRSETASVAVGSDNANVIAGISNHRLFVSVPIATYPNVAAWTAKLASTPMTVIYELAEPQTISLGKVDLPSLPSPSFSMHVDAAVTPTLDAEWWTQGGEEVGSVYQRTSALEQDVDGLTLELSEKVDSSEEWVSWLHAGTDATTHEPYLAMGKDSDYPSVVYSTDAARFYDGEGDAAENVVASFGTDGVVVGKDGSANTTISDSEIVFHDADGNEAGKISMSSEGAVPASAVYTITTSSTGTVSDTITGITPLPDFTLGYLVIRDKVSSGGGGIMRAESWSDVASPVTSSTSTIDYTFKATPNGDTWGIEITATNRSGTTASQTVEYTLEWYYSGSAPQYKFGTGENAGAYSFLAGLGLETAKPAQVVLGSYNEPSQTNLFIVGNGTSDGNRSNALWIDENSVLHIVSFSQYAGGVELTQSALWSWQQALFGYSDSEDWTYLAGSASGNFCRWRIASGWMQVEIYYTSGAGLTANTAKHYGAIPGNFAPDHEVNNALYLGANKNGQADMWVTSGGAVWVNSTIASSTVYGQLQYPIQRPL